LKIPSIAVSSLPHSTINMLVQTEKRAFISLHELSLILRNPALTQIWFYDIGLVKTRRGKWNMFDVDTGEKKQTLFSLEACIKHAIRNAKKGWPITDFDVHLGPRVVHLSYKTARR